MTTGNFFAVDRQTWARVCRMGINEAISFLVMARGTGRDNRTTSWSVLLIESRTSISRPMARLAVKAIVEGGIAEQIRGGTRPQYKLAIGASPAPAADPDRLNASYRMLLQQVAKAGSFWIDGRRKTDITRANNLVGLGLLKRDGVNYALADPVSDRSEPEWIWLPNALIDGLGDEVVPVELLRQTNSLDAVRMFVNLYAEHDIRDDAGLPWRPENGIWRKYERVKLNERGEYVVWGFGKWSGSVSYGLYAAERHRENDPSLETFWSTFNLLVELGLTEVVAHLVLAHDEQGEVLHPLPVGTQGEPIEKRITAAAKRAATAMVPAGTDGAGLWAVAPVKRHVRDVQLIGIVRLRYRPQTSATDAWIAKAAAWTKWADAYTALGDRLLGVEPLQAGVATSRDSQGGIKVSSRGHQ